MTERDFFAEPFSREELERLVELAGGAGELFSWRSPSARPYKEERGRLSDEQLLDLMLENPRLIRRPIVLRGGDLVLGFDRDAIAGLLA